MRSKDESLVTALTPESVTNRPSKAALTALAATITEEKPSKIGLFLSAVAWCAFLVLAGWVIVSIVFYARSLAGAVW
jgi:hypothetical protein